jgi:hypothetical protein
VTQTIGQYWLADVLIQFRKQKDMAEKAMAQLDDAQLFASIDDEANSVAVIVKHVAGNMRSRWTDFLTSDGEKATRHRDAEFEMTPTTTRAEVMGWWEDGWRRVFAALEPLGEADLMRQVTIRREAMTVIQAIDRQVNHYANHIGQIVFLAKHLRGRAWKTLSIPRGQSEQYLAGTGPTRA